MKDIKILETCNNCGKHLSLMTSLNMDTGETWLVKRCLNCWSFRLQEVIRVFDPENFDYE